MKDFLICLVVLLLIFVPAAFAQQYDSRSVSSRYDPNSADSINNPYSQANQYSPDKINNPYSPTNQYSPKNFSSPSIQQEHDWHVTLVDPEQSAAKAAQQAKKVKETAAEAQARKFFGDGKPKKQVPVFFYLLVVSSLAVGATVLIIIASLKK